jgi:hypothetical protein
MRIFRVIAGSCVGRVRTYEYGAEITEDALPKGNADKMVKAKFLVEIDPETRKEIKKEIDDTEDIEETNIDVNLRNDEEEQAKADKEKRDGNLNPPTGEVKVEIDPETRKEIKKEIDDTEDIEETNIDVNLRNDEEEQAKADKEKRDGNLNPPTGEVKEEKPLRPVTGLDDVSIEKIFQDLTTAGIQVNPKATKEELYKLWLAI